MLFRFESCGNPSVSDFFFYFITGIHKKQQKAAGAHRKPFPAGQCHQLKTGAFVLCEKTAKQMQLVGAGLCSARQDTPNYRKSSANPYALTRLAVEADAHIGPAECTVFTGIYGEFVTSQWADRVVGPYNNPSHSL